uniref:TonB-dependent receptor domain-containing protein n=1 Tax=Flavobacterium sp. TaxID=239 RepID=UPI004049C595
MKNILLTLFLFTSIVTIAQNYIVEGKILGKTNEPLVNETIYLLSDETNSIVKTAVTDNKGTFVLVGLYSGTYVIFIASEGYEVFRENISVSNVNLTLENIQLTEKVAILDEVVVKAEKPMIQVMADKTVFNVNSSINTAGTTVWELFRKAPGVIIDNNGGIILEGKTGVQIFIDGKITQLNGQELQAYLESLQSSSIDKLEIITQPSSKYDAAGNAGIINIVFKKDKNLGLNGTISNALTYGNFARNSASISLNYRNKKSNLYGNISNGIGKSTGFLYLKRQQNNTEFDAKTESVYDPNSTNIRVGYDYFVTKKSALGVILNTNLYQYNNQNNSRTPIQAFSSTSIDSVLIASNRSNGNSQNYLINTNYKFSDTLETSFNIDLDYGKFTKEGFALQPNFYYDASENNLLSQVITRQETPITIDILSFQTDYEQKLWNGKFATGMKISYVTTNNTFNFFNQVSNDFVLDDTRSNQFEYRENINASYINFNRKMEKWSFQLGLRVENTVSKGDLKQNQNIANKTVKRNYTNWFPSGGLTYQVNAKNQMALNYSKRIQRPNYSSLNPFEYKIDELSFSRGNPFLRPQYTNTIKLSNTYNYKLNTSLSYTYVTDFFAQITEADGDDRNYLNPQNIANQETINLGISLPQKIFKWWNVYLSLNAYTSSYKSDNPSFNEVKQETLSFYAQNTFNLPKDFTLELSGWYSSPSIWGATYVTKSLGSLNLAFQKKFFDNKITAKLAFNDVLFTSPWRGTTRYGIVTINGFGGNDSRNVAFSLSYNFGNNEIKKSRNRNTSLEEEKNRTN